jgi:hypothetical protein
MTSTDPVLPDDYSAEYPFTRVWRSGTWTGMSSINESACKPETSDVDVKIERICRTYLAATEHQRAEYRRRITNASSLLHFAHRMAIRAMRTGDVELLRLGFAAVSLEDYRYDFRDSGAHVLMLACAASRINADLTELFNESAVMSSPRTAESFRRLSKLDPAMRKLDGSPLREGRDANGPTIEWQVP